MQNLQKLKTLPKAWGLGLLSISYLVLHATHLTIIPIFGDEAIYLSWSQTIAEDIKQFFIPLSDGKQPLFMWLTSIATHFFTNPLLAPRIVSVLGGLSGAIAMYLIAKELVSRRAGVFAFVLYSLVPMLFFYNRMGVPDGLLAVFGIWSFYFGLKVVRQPSLKWAVALGLTLGGGLLTKSPAIFSVLLLPTLVFLKPNLGQTQARNLVRVGLYFIPAPIIAGAAYSILRLSALYSVIGQRQHDFVFGLDHLVNNPLDPFVSRIAEVSGWIVGYVTAPIVGLAAIGLLLGLYWKRWFVLSLLLWLLVPLFFEMALAKGFTPRYFVFTIPYLVLLASFGFYWLGSFMVGRLRYVGLFLFLLLSPAIVFDYALLTKPESAPIPQKERSGYLEDWTAGYGIAEVSSYLKSLPRNQKILVGTEGHFGTLPDGLIAYARKSPNLHVEGMGQAVEIRQVPQALFDWLAQDETNWAYLVVNKSRIEVTDSAHLRLLESYPKPAGPKGQDALLFFEVIP